MLLRGLNERLKSSRQPLFQQGHGLQFIRQSPGLANRLANLTGNLSRQTRLRTSFGFEPFRQCLAGDFETSQPLTEVLAQLLADAALLPLAGGLHLPFSLLALAQEFDFVLKSLGRCPRQERQGNPRKDQHRGQPHRGSASRQETRRRIGITVLQEDEPPLVARDDMHRCPQRPPPPNTEALHVVREEIGRTLPDHLILDPYSEVIGCLGPAAQIPPDC